MLREKELRVNVKSNRSNTGIVGVPTHFDKTFRTQSKQEFLGQPRRSKILMTCDQVRTSSHCAPYNRRESSAHHISRYSGFRFLLEIIT